MQNIRVITSHTIVRKQRCVTSRFLVNSLNELISSCLIKASESKCSIDSFIFSFEGSSVTSDLCKSLTILYESWQDRLADGVFSDMFPEQGTPVLFALRHAIYLPRKKRDENKKWLLGERVPF